MRSRAPAVLAAAIASTFAAALVSLACSSFAGSPDEVADASTPDVAQGDGDTRTDASDPLEASPPAIDGGVLDDDFSNGCQSWALRSNPASQMSVPGYSGAGCRLCLQGGDLVVMYRPVMPVAGTLRLSVWVKSSTPAGVGSAKADVGFQTTLADGGPGGSAANFPPPDTWTEYTRTIDLAGDEQKAEVTLAIAGSSGDCVDFDEVHVTRQ